MDTKTMMRIAYTAYRKAKDSKAPAETVERLLLSFIRADYRLRAEAQS